MAKAKTEGLTVEQAIAASRAALATPADPVQEFLEAEAPKIEAPEETPAENQSEDLDAQLDAAFAKLDGGTPSGDTEAKLDPDGTFTFNLEGLPASPENAVSGPLVLSDEAPPPPPVDDENTMPDYEPELAFDFDKLPEQTKAEIIAGRQALARGR